jgi:hypothetical protein
MRMTAAAVGAMVHFVNPDSARQVLPAVVVLVGQANAVNLQVFTDGPDHLIWEAAVRYDDAEVPAPRTWHWPPRAEAD